MPAKVRLSHSVIVRAPGLLPMLYTVNELERELHVSVRVIRDWLTKGLPHQRDARRHIWLDGRQFAAWVETQRHAARRSATRLNDDEAYCVNCRRPVKLMNATPISRGKNVLLNGTCPVCGKQIYRGVKHGQSTQLPTGL